MARPIKLELDYFRLDVNFFTNIKMRRLNKKFGCNGLSLYIFFLCEIYKQSYYVIATEDFIFDVSDRLNMTTEEVEEALRFMVKIDLFDQNLFERRNAITSKSIQTRYAMEKGKSLHLDATNVDFWLLGSGDEMLNNDNKTDTQNNTEEPDMVLQGTTEVNPTITPINPSIMPQSKEKKSRVLKRKEKKNKIEGGSKTLPTNTRTRVREADEILPLSDFDLNIFLEDKEWCDAAIAVAPAKDLTMENLYDKLNEFRNFIITTGGETTVKNIDKFKRRFFYWLERKQLVNKNILLNPNMNKVPPATNNSYNKKQEEVQAKPLSIVKQMLKEKCTKKK